MNRRDVMRMLLGTAATAGVTTGSVAQAAPGPREAFLLVLEAPGPISGDCAERIKLQLHHALNDTAFAGSKVFVLGDGVKLSVLGPDGRVRNRPVRLPAKRRRQRGERP